jgi:hypothetical protein
VGGFRAMAGMNGFVKALWDEHIFDGGTYMVVLSRSTWYLSSLYSDLEFPKSVSPVDVQQELHNQIEPDWKRFFFGKTIRSGGSTYQFRKYFWKFANTFGSSLMFLEVSNIFGMMERIQLCLHNDHYLSVLSFPCFFIRVFMARKCRSTFILGMDGIFNLIQTAIMTATTNLIPITIQADD